MRWWHPLSGDPGDGPPPEVYEADVEVVEPEPARPRLVSVKEVGEWMSAAEEREFLVWKEIDSLLDELKPRWPMRTRMLRRELRWLRQEARSRGYRWSI